MIRSWSETWTGYHSWMSWWDRYRAWQPESSWDRYQGWRLESRTRFVATSVAVRALIVFLFLWLASDSSAGRALLLTAIFAVLAILLWGFWAYPRAKAKSEPASVPTRTTAG